MTQQPASGTHWTFGSRFIGSISGTTGPYFRKVRPPSSE